MPWTATERYRIQPAPAGLALVQDLVNTRPIRHCPDLLANLPTARRWLTEATGQWSDTVGLELPKLAMTSTDLAQVRRLRSSFALLLKPEPEVAKDLGGTVTLRADADGQIRLQPDGRGWRWLSAALTAEVSLAQQRETWPRLKLCHNPECGSAFYDHSRNHSAVWHDARTCGNLANLRASRERKRRSDAILSR